jgi:hypothetical protein
VLFRVLPGCLLEGPFGPQGSHARFSLGGALVDLTAEQFEVHADQVEPADAEAIPLHFERLKRLGPI